MTSPVKYNCENLKHLRGIANVSSVPSALKNMKGERYGPFVWQGIMGTIDKNGFVLPTAVLQLPIQVEYNKGVVGGYSDAQMTRIWKVATVFDEAWIRGEKIMPYFGPTHFPSGSHYIGEWFKNLAQADEDKPYDVIEQPEPRYGVKTVLQTSLDRTIPPRELVDRHVTNYLGVRQLLLDIPEDERENDARVQLGVGFLEYLVEQY